MGLAMVTVGSTVVASAVIGDSMPPFAAAALRFGVALPVLVVMMLVRREARPRPDRHDTVLLVIQGAAGSAGYTALLVVGTGLTSASEAGIILGCLPAVAGVIAFVALRERLAAATIAAIALSTLGVAITSFGAMGTAGSLAGNALILAAVVCEGVFLLANRLLHAPVSPLALATTMCAFGLVLSLPVALGEVLRGEVQPESSAIVAAVYYGLVPTVAGFWMWYSGSAGARASDASVMTGVAPISAVILSVVVLGERLSAAHIVGLVAVLAAIVVVARSLGRPVERHTRTHVGDELPPR
jgi:drug/metabolite transporter (DMT)-like permease